MRAAFPPFIIEILKSIFLLSGKSNEGADLQCLRNKRIVLLQEFNEEDINLAAMKITHHTPI